MTAFLRGSFCAEWLGGTQWACPVTSDPMSTILASRSLVTLHHGPVLPHLLSWGSFLSTVLSHRVLPVSPAG